MRTPSYASLAALLVVGCEAPKPSPLLLVRMDSAAYTRDSLRMAHAGFTVTNAGSAPAIIQGCPPPDFAVDTGATGRWVEYSSGRACLDLPISYQVVEPGDSARGQFSWDWPATYRIRVYYGRVEAPSDALQSAGGPFSIR